MIQEPEFLQEKPKTEEKSLLSPATIFLIVALVLFVVIMGIALFRQNQTQPRVGDTAPSFEVTSYDGQVYKSEDLLGQIVIVNLWANWCAPCHFEAPGFEQIYREYADEGVLLLGVNWLDIESEAMSFINRYDLSYPNAPDTGELVYNAFHVQAMPETFVIGRDGRIAGVFIGGVTYDQLAQLLDSLLAEGV
jgi:cytochrome c biogenesis protein CcmG, thiol:disulfide interchange protein DsbE